MRDGSRQPTLSPGHAGAALIKPAPAKLISEKGNCSDRPTTTKAGAILGALLFIRDAFAMSPLIQGVVTSIALLGAAVGAVFAGGLSDRFGRRPLILVTALIVVAGSLLFASATVLWVLLAGRLLVGLGIGVSSMLAPLYLAETARPTRAARWCR